MLSSGSRAVLLVVFGFLLITSEFHSDFAGSEVASDGAAAPARASIFADAQWGGRRGWGGGYGGGWGRRGGWGGGYGGGWGRRGGYGGGWGRRGGYWG